MPRRNVFVAYPYSLFPRDDYRNVFQNIEKSHPVNFRFADDFISNDYILEKIRKMIDECDLSLFDITGWNPNVTLELGIATALNREPYILFNTRHSQHNEAPSDIRGKERIQYSSYYELGMSIMNLLRQLNLSEPREIDEPKAVDASDIARLLENNPGLRVTQIAEAMGAEVAMVQSLIRIMLKENKLKTRGEGRGTVYFNIYTDLRRLPRR